MKNACKKGALSFKLNKFVKEFEWYITLIVSLSKSIVPKINWLCYSPEEIIF